MTATSSLSNRFLPLLRADSLEARDSRLLLERDGDIEVFYAPFDHVNAAARLVLVGITPGFSQATTALRVAHDELSRGATPAQAEAEAKRVAAFSGKRFRSNIVSQLDDWGIDQWLGIATCSELFESKAHLVHCTSLLRYPVFVAGKNYGGSPSILGQPLLRRYLEEYFVREVNALNDALFVGLGPKVWKVLERLASEGRINRDQVVMGILHGSGENNYRVDYLTGPRSEPAPWATNPQPYDRGRTLFRNRHLCMA